MKFFLPDTEENMENLRSLVQFELLLKSVTGVRGDGRIVFEACAYNKGVSNKKLKQIVRAKPFRAKLPTNGEHFEIKPSRSAAASSAKRRGPR